MHPYDSSAVRNFRQTDIYTHRLYIPRTCDRKNSLHVVSSVLHSRLYINTLLSCWRETWGGTSGAHREKGWLEAHSQYRTSSTCLARNDKGWFVPHAFLARVTYFYTGTRVMGVSMVIASRGEGVTPTPPLPRQITCRPPKTRVTNTGQAPDKPSLPHASQPPPPHSIR